MLDLEQVDTRSRGGIRIRGSSGSVNENGLPAERIQIANRSPDRVVLNLSDLGSAIVEDTADS
jgi:hypothetical protein